MITDINNLNGKQIEHVFVRKDKISRPTNRQLEGYIIGEVIIKFTDGESIFIRGNTFWLGSPHVINNLSIQKYKIGGAVHLL